MARWTSFNQFLNEAQAATPDNRQTLVDELLREHPETPWVDGTLVTFLFTGVGVERVAVNLDIIENDPPFIPMTRLEGTTLWYAQRRFRPDDLLDYLIVVDDPMTPLAEEKNLLQRIARHWRIDPRNPIRMSTAQMEVSVLHMPKARPFPDWSRFNVPRGQIFEHEFSSVQMHFEKRKLWVYTPPGYDPQTSTYPLLVLFDGQWMLGPLQVPYIADALVKHQRMQPTVIAMLQSGNQAQRVQEFVSNDRHYAAILTELLPFLQDAYALDATDLGVGGVDVGAIAAAYCALRNPAVFSHLIMLSPPLGRGQAQERLVEYADRFASARLLPQRIFQSVGRYENRKRFYDPGLALGLILQRREIERGDIDHEFIEIGSGHGLVAFKAAFPEALAHIFPARVSEKR
jgi:enterochelin esterase family protein